MHILLKTGALSHVDLVGNNLFLGFWTSSSIPGLTQGGYMAIYASLGKNWIPVFCFFRSELIDIFFRCSSGHRFFPIMFCVCVSSPPGYYDINRKLMETFSVMSLFASLNLFKTALNAILRSPTSFFDTTPLGLSPSLFYFCLYHWYIYIGRVLSRLSKDQDTLDNELWLTLMQVRST